VNTGKQTIWCISGLGADEKAFSKLTIEGYELKVIPWLKAVPGEDLVTYAARMSEPITDEDPILMGLSFGGIICSEIAKQRPVKLIILISSIKTAGELPFWLRSVGKLSLHKLFPMRSSKLTAPFQNIFLGVTNAEDKRIATAYRKASDPLYTRWAIDLIVHWKNDIRHPQLFHIHGTRDRIFPLRYLKADYTVANGGHFMIMNRAGEVSSYINEVLKKL
jgi:pimeloyl-ACP methyl ester carboxylesterase